MENRHNNFNKNSQVNQNYLQKMHLYQRARFLMHKTILEIAKKYISVHSHLQQKLLTSRKVAKKAILRKTSDKLLLVRVSFNLSNSNNISSMTSQYHNSANMVYRLSNHWGMEHLVTSIKQCYTKYHKRWRSLPSPNIISIQMLRKSKKNSRRV